MWITVILGHLFSHVIEFNLLHLYFQCSGILWSAVDDKSAIKKKKPQTNNQPTKKNQTQRFLCALRMKLSWICLMEMYSTVVFALCICESFSFIIKGYYYTELFNIYLISCTTFQDSSFFMWLKYTYPFKTCISCCCLFKSFLCIKLSQ